jgi:hypothetical protein
MNNFDFIEKSLTEYSGKAFLSEAGNSLTSTSFGGRLFTTGSLIVSSAFQKLVTVGSYIFGSSLAPQNQEINDTSLTEYYHQNLNSKLQHIQQMSAEDVDFDLISLMKKYEL